MGTAELCSDQNVWIQKVFTWDHITAQLADTGKVQSLRTKLTESRLFCALQHGGCDIYYYEYHLY